MRNPRGYATIISPDKSVATFDRIRRREEIPAGIFEADTFCCAHCNSVVHVSARSQGDEYFCRNCMARICSPCADHPCIPFMKKLEQMEHSDYVKRQYAMCSG